MTVVDGVVEAVTVTALDIVSLALGDAEYVCDSVTVCDACL